MSLLSSSWSVRLPPRNQRQMLAPLARRSNRLRGTAVIAEDQASEPVPSEKPAVAAPATRRNWRRFKDFGSSFMSEQYPEEELCQYKILWNPSPGYRAVVPKYHNIPAGPLVNSPGAFRTGSQHSEATCLGQNQAGQRLAQPATGGKCGIPTRWATIPVGVL